MNEQQRLRELERYKILDTPAEQELDDLVEIASAIFGAPVSLISFINETRQWFKAKKGLEFEEMPRETSFCQHTLYSPNAVLVVDDPLNDERFKNSPLVQSGPHVLFYAGAPLETPNGNVIGTICVLDNKRHIVNEDQKKALMLLSKKVMGYLEMRNILIEQNDKIEFNAARLKKLTDRSPGAIYQLEMNTDGDISFAFISKGIADLHPKLTIDELTKNPKILFKVIHPDDLHAVKKSMDESFLRLSPWSVEYRVVRDNNKITWLWANANPERKEDGTVAWYGTLEDITDKKEYIQGLEDILFDISHVMRKPVTTMIGLVNNIQTENLNQDRLKKSIQYIKIVSIEMDDYTKKLTEKYFEIRQKAIANKNTTIAVL
ncbi:MAG: PAS domain-containing protein [Ginsengibacter sp.]